MAGAVGEVRLEGLRELNRSLSKVNREIAGEVREALKKAAEPVRSDAESLAFGHIRNIGSRWGRMRVGSTVGTVYVAPATRRGRGTPRRNLGVLLMNEAMVPALDKNQERVVHEVEVAFDRLANRAGF